MVEVRVREQDRVEVPRFIGQRHAVADDLVGAALEHAAIDEDLRATGLDEELGAGDRRGGAQELEIHGRDGAI